MNLMTLMERNQRRILTLHSAKIKRPKVKTAVEQADVAGAVEAGGVVEQGDAGGPTYSFSCWMFIRTQTLLVGY